eukprot:1190990-Prorocentrum_minimum.AAC.3
MRVRVDPYLTRPIIPPRKGGLTGRRAICVTCWVWTGADPAALRRPRPPQVAGEGSASGHYSRGGAAANAQVRLWASGRVELMAANAGE